MKPRDKLPQGKKITIEEAIPLRKTPKMKHPSTSPLYLPLSSDDDNDDDDDDEEQNNVDLGEEDLSYYGVKVKSGGDEHSTPSGIQPPPLQPQIPLFIITTLDPIIEDGGNLKYRILMIRDW